MSLRSKLKNAFHSNQAIELAGVVNSSEGYVISQILENNHNISIWYYIASNARKAENFIQSFKFFAPRKSIIYLPAWDCLPFDRVSPTPLVSANRMTALANLCTQSQGNFQTLIVLTANSALQRTLDKSTIPEKIWKLKAGQIIIMDSLVHWLQSNAFSRVSIVHDVTEYAVRGSIIDIFLPGNTQGIRLDFFGQTLESIRYFDVETQRSKENIKEILLVPVSEVTLDHERIDKFRQNYRSAYGALTRNDPLYVAISEGRRYPGIEHWLGYLEDQLVPIFDFFPNSPIILEQAVLNVVEERATQINEYYHTRLEQTNPQNENAIYRPAEPNLLYLTNSEWDLLLMQRQIISLIPFVAGTKTHNISLEGNLGRNFASERISREHNLFDSLTQHIQTLQKVEKKRVILVSWSEGARERLSQILKDHGLLKQRFVNSWPDAKAFPTDVTNLAVMEIEHGFQFSDLALITDEDVLGDRIIRRSKRQRKDSKVLHDATNLNEGDYVVHLEHGIAQFIGLTTITAADAPHDCLELAYAGGDRLYLPVENIDLLTRYSSSQNDPQLDKLGGGAWQARKARTKKRIRDIAEKLIQIAAERTTKAVKPICLPPGIYEEFAARFPYEETDDQLQAIETIMHDLMSDQPMDRLVCGDVGFGKTEVALRAAFMAAMNGQQVAVIVPTTLLSRQHYKTFLDRFKGLPVKIGQASRLVSNKELVNTKQGISNGSIDIVIGTHALLGKNIQFHNLGLLIIDEEQHFGVRHKERLKELKFDVHVLTLTATPIPRTLQLALTGVRELSLIATPPIDRIAVRTFISPTDTMMIREALLREYHRGGQSFYVCPRVSDLTERKAFLEEHVPEVKVVLAHGQLPANQLDDVMNAFYDKKYDVLLSTTIVESGLDIPTANTLIVHRAHMFGLAQLYQLRGRVGRSKIRAYALFTTPPNMKLTTTAERRLRVLQSLNTLGAGFQLASHDMDIRGAGNLLGEEQSGHIKEVGFELYQDMLKEAIHSLKSGKTDIEEDEQWSPQITLGLAVMIPEGYVPDLSLRLSLYKELAALETEEEINEFRVDLRDRFGPIPEEVEHLLKIVLIKFLCRRCNIEKVDSGSKGMVISLRKNTFPNPQGLINYIAQEQEKAKLRSDHKIVLIREWPEPEQRLTSLATILHKLAHIAEEAT